MGISLSEGIGWSRCCKQNSLIPNPPPDSCPLVLDGVGDSLTWADPRATPIAPFNLDFSMDFWFSNKATVAQSFTILSLGREISGTLYDTIALKYDHTANKLVVELISDITGTSSTAYAEFELHSAQNSSITGFADVNDKWIECEGNVALHNFVHLFLSIPEKDSGTDIIDASLINIWWNGQLLTASATQDNLWDVSSAYYTNFLTLGDYRGATTAASGNSAFADIYKFQWRDSYYASSTGTASIIYNSGYPHTTLYQFNWYAFGITTAAPSGTSAPTDLFLITGGTLTAQLNDNAAIVCGPVQYTCAAV